VAISLASLAMTLPIALSSPRSASAGALVTARARTSLLDALRTSELVAVHAADPSGDSARFAVDGRDDTVWTGRPGEAQWLWTSAFAHPVHVGLIRAHFGRSATSGVPTVFRWDVVPRDPDRTSCDPPSPDDERWTPLSGGAQRSSAAADMLAQPTRRSWFVDTEACALRLVVDKTNAGPPVVREVQAIESAEDVLRHGHASDDGTYFDLDPSGAIDGSYGGRWAGAPGKSRWTLRIDLPAAEPIDRIRLVLGFDATSVPRGPTGRAYAVSWAPLHYTLEVSDDGQRFLPVASEPTRADGTAIPLRRRLVTLAEPRSVRSIRVVMIGATGDSGLPEAGAVPVVREMAAYRADDTRPILSAPWILSINANPAAQSHRTPGGEVTNDAYHAKFLQARMTQLLPALADDDRFARALGMRGEPLDAPPHEDAGGVLESIEGDDPQLDAAFLTESSPPPIAILSGSNDWDYDGKSGPDAAHPKRWHWDPLRDARAGGMGQLAAAVQNRVAPFLGFCGGAQILALLEARRGDSWDGSPERDARLIDRILSRTTGEPIRGFATPLDVERAWPTDPHPLHARIEFLPGDPLFADVAGPFGRSVTQALPESHADAIRPDAFGPGGPLARFEVVAKSAFCSAGVPRASATGLRDDAFPNPAGTGYCATVPEAFRSRDPAWPVIGAQFHAEQRDFSSAAPGDPPESTADPRLFLAAAYETMIDAYVRLAP
jgi:hypothetical protein